MKITMLACENTWSGPSVKVMPMLTKSKEAVTFVLGHHCYLGYSPRGSYMEICFERHLDLVSTFQARMPGCVITESAIERFYNDLVDDYAVLNHRFRELLMPMVPDDFTVIYMDTYDGSAKTYDAGFLKGVKDVFAYMNDPKNAMVVIGDPKSVIKGERA